MPGTNRGGPSKHGIPIHQPEGASPDRVAELRALFLAGGDSAILRALAEDLAWLELEGDEPSPPSTDA